MALRATTAISYFNETTNLIASVVGTIKLGGVDAPTATTATVNPGVLVVGQSNQETKDLALYLDRSVWRDDDDNVLDLVMRHVRQPLLLTQ